MVMQHLHCNILNFLSLPHYLQCRQNYVNFLQIGFDFITGNALKKCQLRDCTHHFYRCDRSYVDLSALNSR